MNKYNFKRGSRWWWTLIITYDKQKDSKIQGRWQLELNCCFQYQCKRKSTSWQKFIFFLNCFWLVDISSWQDIIFFLNFLSWKVSSGQEHNFLVGWSGKCDAPGPRDQSDGITQISKQRKNKQGKISQQERQLFKMKKKSPTSFSISECAVVGAEEGLRIKWIRSKNLMFCWCSEISKRLLVSLHLWGHTFISG